ncbi:MAG: alpha/beta hydrolase fold domain-containing protein [Ruminococcus sp.]|jgi:acetyl esterase/lipase|nr:alpha/beta hydrolase fold domain-containing protein [Ruminococcus sp.]
MSKYNIHPDFAKFQKIYIPMDKVALPIYDFFLTKAFYDKRLKNSVTENRATVKSYEGKEIKLTIIRPKNAEKKLPALVYFHGGAFALQASAGQKETLADFAEKTPCTVIFADYRLLPKATFPTGLEDCFAAYKWVLGHSAKLGIDDKKIAVGGDSAGGCLALGVSLLARERGAAMPCFQLLIYPVTDERQATHSMKKFIDTPLWNQPLNKKMWELYLADGLPLPKMFASPAEAQSYKGLPKSYIEVSEFDCLRDEGIILAKRLEEEGIEVTLSKTERTIHGFEIAPNNPIVKQAIEDRIGALRRAFE